MTYGDSNPEVIKEAIHEMQKREFKGLVKDAIKEWLDEQAVKVGKWSTRFIVLAVLGALAYFVLTMNGWSHK